MRVVVDRVPYGDQDGAEHVPESQHRLAPIFTVPVSIGGAGPRYHRAETGGKRTVVGVDAVVEADARDRHRGTGAAVVRGSEQHCGSCKNVHWMPLCVEMRECRS